MRLPVVCLLLLAASAVRASCGDADAATSSGIGPDDLTIAGHVERQWPAAIRSLAYDSRVNQTYGVLDAYEDIRRRKQWSRFECDITRYQIENIVSQVLAEYEEHANKTAAMVRMYDPLYAALDEPCIISHESSKNDDFVAIKSLYALLFLIPDNRIDADPLSSGCPGNTENKYASLYLVLVITISVTSLVCLWLVLCDQQERGRRAREQHRRTSGPPPRRGSLFFCCMNTPVSDPESAMKSSFQEDACAVCFTDFDIDDEMAQFACGHACVCVSCAVKISDSAAPCCPLCREPFDGWTPWFYSRTSSNTSDRSTPSNSSDSCTSSNSSDSCTSSDD